MRRMKNVPTPSPAENTEETTQAIETRSAYLHQQRRTTAQRLMSQGASQVQVSQMLMEAEPGLEHSLAKKTYYDVLKETRQTFEKEMPYHRAMQLQRLHSDLVTMRSERSARNLPAWKKRPNMADINRTETLVARITGTLAPLKVVIDDPNEVLSSSMRGILANMSPEDTEALIAEGEALE